MTGSHPTSNVEDKSDFTVPQGWDDYSQDDHATWRLLFERQARVLKRRVIDEFLEGLAALKIDFSGIPDFRRLSDVLDKATGMAGGCGARSGSGRCVLRAFGQPAFSGL